MNISAITHPDYFAMVGDWTKWRITYEGGSVFIDKYLQKFSNRETDAEFAERKAVTYCPAFAKAALNEVKNSIYQRMVDISRKGGTPTYQQAIDGQLGGVDLCGSSMNHFIGCDVLEEMLKMRYVGVYVDMPSYIGASLTDQANKHPYLYTYTAEDIRAWSYDKEPGEFKAVLLQDYIYRYDEETGFPTDYVTRYRRVWKQDGVVLVAFYNETGKPIDTDGVEIDQPSIIELPVLPFVLFEISDSLMKDIADYQIALLNLASADMSYSLKQNFPFYVEAYEPRARSEHLRPVGQDGTATEAGKGKPEEVKVGVAKGRRYPMGLDAPSFIHPSSEPLTASMAKQTQLKEEIRQLLGMTIANLTGPKMASAESKSKDEKSLEAGLSYIGLALENGERKIANIWSKYERSDKIATISYPETYSLRTETDRREEATELSELMPIVPSKTYQKSVAKKIAKVMLGSSTTREDMEKIESEINEAPGMMGTFDSIASDLEHGILSNETGCVLRGYDKSEAKKAEKDHAERLKRIQDAQTPPGGIGPDAAARGIKDQGGDPLAGKTERAAASDPSKTDTGKKPDRGEGK